MATVTSIQSAQQQVLTAASNQLSGGICLDNVKTSTPTLVDDAVVKPRTTLPAKYNKFLQFGFYLMKKINSDDENHVIDETLFLDKLRIFDTIDSQQSFVQEFIDSSKAINQTLRKMVQVHKKNIIKAAKVKAPRVKKVKEPKLPKEKKEKKNAKQKKNIPAEEDVLVDELVRLAQGTYGSPETPPLSGEPTLRSDPPETQGTYGSPETPPLAEVVSEVVPEVVIEVKKEKKVKEPKPAKEPKPVKEAKPVKEPKVAKEAKPAKEPKVAKKAVKEDKVEPKVEDNVETTVEAKVEDDEEEDLELDVSPYIHNNVKYLIDDAKNIYHFDTHQFISTLQQLLTQGNQGSP
jgi:hypothetical protein